MAAPPLPSFHFEAEIIHWRGPAPYYFAPLPQSIADQIATQAKRVSYGWGVIPVEASIGAVVFTTSLFPKDGTYLLPLKDSARSKLIIPETGVLSIDLTLRDRAVGAK